MASEEKCFTFTWKLENVNYFLEKNASISSPYFVMECIDESKWNLVIKPWLEKGPEYYVGFYLYRSASSKRGAKVSIKYELAFLAKDGSVLTSWVIQKREFSTSGGHGFRKFQKGKDVFFTKRSDFLPQDTLTARCRIWKSVGEMTEDVRCLARTRIGVKKRSFFWNITNFPTFQSGKNYTYEIKSVAHDKELMSINLSLTDGLSSEEIICFELNLRDQAIRFSRLLLSLVDISGNRIECNRDEFWFDDASKSKEFKFFFTKNKLMKMRSSYLPDDNLCLQWEFAFSKGIVSQEIENVEYVNSRFDNKSSNALHINNQNIIPLSYPLNDNLKSLYDKSFLCDVKLKTSARIFNAHKVVLSASSSVFEAMFASNMKEKDSNCVNIDDLNDDTISRMLAYIYTARITDLTWERARLLYVAADKYAIFSLKQICSSYMMDNISPINSCEVLMLSELHADCDLKSFVQNYMLKHLKEIISSDGWKNLMETNAKLAADTVILPYIQIK